MNFQKFFIVFFVLTLLLCCNDKIEFVSKIQSTNLTKTKFGETNFHILLPENMKAEEVHGKEGFYGIYINSKDTSSKMFGVITFNEGHLIGQKLKFQKNKLAVVKSELLNDKTNWTIYKVDKPNNSDYSAETKFDKLIIEVSSDKIQDVKYLISIMATLSKQ